MSEKVWSPLRGPQLDVGSGFIGIAVAGRSRSADERCPLAIVIQHHIVFVDPECHLIPGRRGRTGEARRELIFDHGVLMKIMLSSIFITVPWSITLQ